MKSRIIIKKNSKGFTLIELERSKSSMNTLCSFRRAHHIRSSVRRNEGFTLIELLAVTAVITILTAAILLNYKNSGQQFALQRSTHKLAQDIRRAAEKAMSAQECPIDKCGGPPAIIPSRYGLEFEKGENYYILFADINDNGTYESGPGSQDKEIEQISFEEGVSIKDLYSSIGGPFSSKNQLCVTFKPPAPAIEIRDPAVGRSSGRIELTNAQNQTKTIDINAVGLIDIN